MKEKLEKLKNNKNLIISVLTFLIVLILAGVSYAWFSANVIGNDTAKTTVVEAADLELTYIDGPEINEENIVPGWTATKTFTVENTGDATVTYKIAWNNLTNNFIHRQYLIYSATSTNGGGTLNQTQIPNSENHILIMDNISIAPGVTQAYTMTFQFLNAEGNQNSDQAKSMSGKIEVLDVQEDTVVPQTTSNTMTIPSTDTLYGQTMQDLINTVYPVGSVYTSINEVDPADIMSGTTWEKIEGTFLLSSSDDYTLGDTGGEAMHTLTTAEMPSHTHNLKASALMYSLNCGGSVLSNTTNGDWKGSGVFGYSSVTATGGGTAHNNMPPYLTVNMWKRTS